MEEFENPEWWQSVRSVMDMVDDMEEVGYSVSLDTRGIKSVAQNIYKEDCYGRNRNRAGEI